jgi:hypothetical protein
MHWRVFGLVGSMVLLSHHRGLAEEQVLSPPTPDVHVATETALTELRLPPHDLVEMAERVRCCSGSEGNDRTEPPATLTMKERAPSLGPPLRPLPALMQELLARGSRDSPVMPPRSYPPPRQPDTLSYPSGKRRRKSLLCGWIKSGESPQPAREYRRLTG